MDDNCSDALGGTILTLTLVSYRNLPPGRPATMRFDSSGGTIGRSDDNDWVLPDPECHLSKRHCRISYRDGQYAITDISTNGVFLNDADQPLGDGTTTMLRDCDRLVIGDFKIDVRITEEAAHVKRPLVP